MTANSYRTITYTDGDYLVDIVTTPTTYEAWICHKGYGTKNLMFGMPKDQQTRFEFMQIVEANIDDYKESEE